MKRSAILRMVLLLPCLAWAVQTQAQRVVLKTNLAYWATTTPNLGVEIALSPRYSLDISGSYNAWNFGRGGLSLRHFLIQPELRRWFDKPYQGHFIGLHAHYAKYNIGQIRFIPSMNGHTFRGNLYGAGLSYGYLFPLGESWKLELSLGLGYAYMSDTRYAYSQCSTCAEPVGHYTRHYFGPTKLGVSILYILK